MADVARIPLADGSVDGDVCFSTFPHFPDKVGALREMDRVLRPRGSIWILHVEGRAVIAHSHHETGGPIAGDVLPVGEEMQALVVSAGLVPVAVRDAEDHYWVEARKNPTVT